MFERKQKKVEVPTIETKTITVPTVEGIKDMIVPAVTSAAAIAKDRSTEYAHNASEWAKPHLEQGRGMAEHRVGEVKGLVEGAMPKVAAALAAGAAAKEEALHRSSDAALVLKGDATIKRRKVKGERGFFGKLVTTLGLLTLAGAVATYLAKKAQEPKDDPWARPLTDPYIAPGATGTVADTPVVPTGAPVANDVTPPVVAPTAPVGDVVTEATESPIDTPVTDPDEVEKVDLTAAEGAPVTPASPSSTSLDDEKRD